MRETKYQGECQIGIIDPLNKALGRMDTPLAPADADQVGWNLLSEDLSLPAGCAL